jgi:hypothetical protein
MALLSLARCAINAEAGPLWKKDVEEAVTIYGAACDALWNELRRQLDVQDGKVPVLEHPSVQQKALAQRMRGTIITACRSAIEEALSNLEYEHE